jgi:GcrA cell cycle regulator
MEEENKPVYRIKWTQEEIDFVIQAHADGYSAGATAKLMTELGMRSDCAPLTRNMIVGVWDRHRDKLTARPDKIVRLPKIVSPKEPKENRVPNKPNPPNFQYLQRMDTLKATESEDDGRVTIVDLKNRQCRFPFGDPRNDDFHYCAEPIDYAKGRSYCKFHYAICYVPPERR